MYEKVYRNFLNRIILFENIDVVYSKEEDLQNSIFITIDVYHQKIHFLNKKCSIMKRTCIPLIVCNTEKSHTKLLVIEHNLKKVYIFDPYGYDNYFENTVEDFFEILSYKLNLEGYELITERESNSLCSFQYFEEEENSLEGESKDSQYNFEKCVLWVFWFIEMLELHPELNYKNLLEYLYNKYDHTSYRKIINEYFDNLN